MLDLVFQNFTNDKSLKQDFFARIIEAGIEELTFGNKKMGVSVNLIGENQIKNLNKKYRKKDKVTDVLSFPMYGRSQKKLPVTSYQLPVTDLGDIFICLSFAKKKAKSENISIERKLAELTMHGFLHLLGYDHEKSRKEAEKMFGLEKKILNRLGIP